MLKVIDTNILKNNNETYNLLYEHFISPNNKACISDMTFAEIFNCTLNDPIINNGYKRIWQKFSVLKDFSKRIEIANSGEILSKNIFARLDANSLINKKASFSWFINELELAASNGKPSKDFEPFFHQAYVSTRNAINEINKYCETMREEIIKFDRHFSENEINEFRQNKISESTILKICGLCRIQSISALDSVTFRRMVTPEFDCNSTFIFQSRLSKFSAYSIFKQGVIPSTIDNLRRWEIDTQNSALALCTDGLLSDDKNLNKVFIRAQSWLSFSDASATAPAI